MCGTMKFCSFLLVSYGNFKEYALTYTVSHSMLALLLLKSLFMKPTQRFLFLLVLPSVLLDLEKFPDHTVFVCCSLLWRKALLYAYHHQHAFHLPIICLIWITFYSNIFMYMAWTYTATKNIFYQLLFLFVWHKKALLTPSSHQTKHDHS